MRDHTALLCSPAPVESEHVIGVCGGAPRPRVADLVKRIGALEGQVAQLIKSAQDAKDKENGVPSVNASMDEKVRWARHIAGVDTVTGRIRAWAQEHSKVGAGAWGGG